MARPNESELIVPLRKAWNITRFKRAPRAIQIIKDHVIQHLKVTEDEEVWIDPSVNEKSGQEELKIHHVRLDCKSSGTTSQTYRLK